MAINIRKVYTRSGDKGETGLIGGVRVPKDDARVECYGSTAGPGAHVGLARSLLDAGDPLNPVLLWLHSPALFSAGVVAPRQGGRSTTSSPRLAGDENCAPIRGIHSCADPRQ